MSARAGIARTDPLHEYTKRRIGYLYQQREVIGHVTTSVDACFGLLQSVRDAVIEDPAIGGSKEDVVPLITSRRDVIAGSGHMNTRQPGHPCRQRN